MKTCARCRASKPLDAFGKCKANKSGLHSYCKTCIAGINRVRYLADPARCKEDARRWAAANPERRRELDNRKARARYQRDPKRAYEASHQWRCRNPDKVAAYDKTKKALRRASVKVLFDAELTHLALHEAADLCRRREAATGFAWHLDHVVPLRCKDACGLHVAHNFAVVPATYNASKKNRFIDARRFVVEARP